MSLALAVPVVVKAKTPLKRIPCLTLHHFFRVLTQSLTAGRPYKQIEVIHKIKTFPYNGAPISSPD
jgi:hypothetical protein